MRATSDLDILSTDAVLVEMGEHEVLAATGADRIRFLHGILTADIAGLPVGGGVRAALLTPKGQVAADMVVLVGAEDVRMVVPAGQGEATAAALSRYAIMDDFVVERRPDLELRAVLGPRAMAWLTAAGADVADLAGRPIWSHATKGELWVVRVRQLGAAGFWAAGGPAALTALLGALERAGLGALERDAADAARIAAGEPVWGKEITPDYFPTEVGRSDAIDYGKGCFLGQEPIVRIRDRGHINWRLCRLRYDGGGSVPTSQAVIESDVKPRGGRITSAARLPSGEGVALGLVHVSIPVGADVRIRDGEASIAARVAGEV